MRVRKVLVMLAAVLGLGVALLPATSAYAAGRPNVHNRPDRVIESEKVDVKAAHYHGVYCGQFKGTLVYEAYYSGKNWEYYFDIDGKLNARCGATVHLRAYFTPYPASPKTELIGDTRGTQNISEQYSNSYGITDMYVEVCVFNAPVGGCAQSKHLADK